MMRGSKNWKTLLLPAGMVAALLGCESEWFPIEPVTAHAPVEFEGALAFVDAAEGGLVIVDPAASAGESGARRFVRVPLDGRVGSMVSIPNAMEPGRSRVVVTDELKARVHVVSDKTGAVKSASTEIPVDTFLFREDGHYAVAFDKDGDVSGEQFVSFPNAVSVLNLKGTTPEVTVVRAGEARARPAHVAFARPTAFGSETVKVQLALLFVQSGVVALDLAAGTTGRVIPLGSPSDPMTPAEALFSNNQGDARTGTVDDVERVFVRTVSGRLLVLTVEPGASGSLEVTLDNIVTPQSEVEDIELYYTAAGEPKLLCATRTGVVVVNGYTGVAESFPLSTPISRLASYTEADTGKAMVIAWSAGTHRSRFYLIEPGALRRGRSRGIDEIMVSQAIVDVSLATGQSRAVLEYVNAQELGFVALDSTRTTDDLRLSTSLSDHALDPAGERVLLTGSVGGLERELFATLELDGLRNTTVELDLSGVRVGQVGAYYWVEHPGAYGSVTFIPRDNLTREAALRFENFLLLDVLDEDARNAKGE